MSPIEGVRFHCQVCADFDFCQNCFDRGQAHNHAFERIDDQGQAAVYVGSPRSRKRALRSVYCYFVILVSPTGLGTACASIIIRVVLIPGVASCCTHV